MNRLPRSNVRIQPPLRGRLATSLAPRQQQDYSLPVVRSRPTIPRKPPAIKISLKQDSFAENLESEMTSKPKLSRKGIKQLESVVTPLDKPQPMSPQPQPQSRLWQWLIGLIVLLILLLVGGGLS